MVSMPVDAANANRSKGYTVIAKGLVRPESLRQFLASAGTFGLSDVSFS